MDCSKRVHVINMSLGGLPRSTEPLFEATVAAGIIFVASAGNSGPSCYTLGYPGLSFNVISSGSTDQFDDLSWFSSLGPYPGFNIQVGRFKPDVVAPGSDVLSANYDTSEFKYLRMSGTSMSAPHVTGLVALLLTREKRMVQEQVRPMLILNTDQNLTYTQSAWCDGICWRRDTFPNSLFGHGRINALKSINFQTERLAGRK